MVWDKVEFWNVLGKFEKLQGHGIKNELGFFFMFFSIGFLVVVNYGFVEVLPLSFFRKLVHVE